MSGTFQIDGDLYPKDPLTKRWTRQRVATGGTGAAIYSAFWQCEMSFGTLQVDGEISFFEGKFLAGGLHNAVLPHPQTSLLTQFTGTNIADFSYEFNDIDSNSWGESARLIIDHIDLSATGTV